MAPKTPYEHLKEQLPAMRLLATAAGQVSPQAREQLRVLEEELAKFERLRSSIDLFSQRYAPLGWVNYDRMSTDITQQLESVTVDEGEELLTQHHLSPGTRLVLKYRFEMPLFKPWQKLYERIEAHCEAEDWLSAIPLLLIVIDGICTTSTSKHPFSGGADAIVFDTETSGPGGIADGMRLLGATRRKLSEEAIAAPYRHGIVHGLNPNFGHPIVAAKALNLLQASTDYFLRLRDEAQRIEKAEHDQRPVSWRETAEQMQKTADFRRALDAWQPRPDQDGVIASSEGEMPPESLPEGVGARYLQLLTKANYGELAKLTVDYPQRPAGYRAGRLRRELQGLAVQQWSIVAVNDVTPGVTSLSVRAKLAVGGQVLDFEGQLRMMFADESFDPLARDMEGGAWYAEPKLTTDLWVLRQKFAPV